MLKRAVLIVLLLAVLFTLFAEAQQAENPNAAGDAPKSAVKKASKKRGVKKSSKKRRLGKRRSGKKGGKKRRGSKRRTGKKGKKSSKKRRGSKKGKRGGKKGGKKRRGSKRRGSKRRFGKKGGKKGGKKRRGSKKGKKAAKVRIVRLKDGRIVKRIRRSGAVLQKVCKILRKVGRKTTVCCKGKAKIVRKKKNVHCRKIRVCKKQVNKCVKKGKKGKPCKRRRIICKKHKVSLRCFIKIPKRKFRWSGPKTCKTGFSLDVKRKGQFRAIRFCKPTPTSAPGKPEGEVRYIASGDPHYSSFENKYTDFYQTGDFLLAQTAHKLVSVHTRQQLTTTWRTYAVNKSVGVLINGKDKFVYQGATNSYIINGKKVNLAVGQTVNFEDGGSVKRTGNTNFEVKCIHNIRVVGDLGGTPGKDAKANFYINVYVFAPTSVAKTISGHCGEGKNHKRENVSGIFAHVVFPEFLQVKVPKATAAQQKAANKACRKAKNIHTKHNCVVDFLLGGALAAKANLGVEAKAKKIEKSITKKRKSIIKKVAKKAAKAAKKASKAVRRR